MTLRILVRGGGDLASGVITRLHRAGWQILVTELPQPMAVRRFAAFSQAVLDEETTIEEMTARRVESYSDIRHAIDQRIIPVMVDPALDVLKFFKPHVLVDGRMRKSPPELSINTAPLVIGLGPGFTAGHDCHAVIETNRGPFLGRVIWQGSAQPDTGVPERMGEHQADRVLRAPADGVLLAKLDIGARARAGEEIARVNGRPILAPFDGVIRGLLPDGVSVNLGMKIGDIDPRGDPRLTRMVSDKALAIGGGVVEAILAWEPFRKTLYSDDQAEDGNESA